MEQPGRDPTPAAALPEDVLCRIAVFTKPAARHIAQKVCKAWRQHLDQPEPAAEWLLHTVCEGDLSTALYKAGGCQRNDWQALIQHLVQLHESAGSLSSSSPVASNSSSACAQRQLELWAVKGAAAQWPNAWDRVEHYTAQPDADVYTIMCAAAAGAINSHNPNAMRHMLIRLARAPGLSEAQQDDVFTVALCEIMKFQDLLRYMTHSCQFMYDMRSNTQPISTLLSPRHSLLLVEVACAAGSLGHLLELEDLMTLIDLLPSVSARAPGSQALAVAAARGRVAVLRSMLASAPPAHDHDAYDEAVELMIQGAERVGSPLLLVAARRGKAHTAGLLAHYISDYELTGWERAAASERAKEEMEAEGGPVGETGAPWAGGLPGLGPDGWWDEGRWGIGPEEMQISGSTSVFDQAMEIALVRDDGPLAAQLLQHALQHRFQPWEQLLQRASPSVATSLFTALKYRPELAEAAVMAAARASQWQLVETALQHEIQGLGALVWGVDKLPSADQQQLIELLVRLKGPEMLGLAARTLDTQMAERLASWGLSMGEGQLVEALEVAQERLQARAPKMTGRDERVSDFLEAVGQELRQLCPVLMKELRRVLEAASSSGSHKTRAVLSELMK